MESFSINGKFRRSQIVPESLLFEEQGKTDFAVCSESEPPSSSRTGLNSTELLAGCKQGGQHVPGQRGRCLVLPPAHDFCF